MNLLSSYDWPEVIWKKKKKTTSHLYLKYINSNCKYRSMDINYVWDIRK